MAATRAATAVHQPSEFVELSLQGRTWRIEHAWVGAEPGPAPLIVFLHEGLGSLAMWRDFPARLCAALGARGLVYSRPGYGRSTPRAAHEAWAPDFMHQQAQQLLPALLQALGVDGRYWLFGHSDGGSIALLHAAHAAERGAGGAVGCVAGCVVLAPHILVEDISLRSIAQAREAYRSTDLRSRLARYHDDADSAFWGWNQIWLHPDFRAWDIRSELASIRCPLLAIQGLDDEYGTLAQIRGIAEHVPGTQLLELAQCGHSPHKDCPEAVITAVRALVLG